MARYKGHEGAAKVSTDAIGEVESFDIDLSTNELDVNVMGSDWTDVEGGQKSASGTVSESSRLSSQESCPQIGWFVSEDGGRIGNCAAAGQ